MAGGTKSGTGLVGVGPVVMALGLCLFASGAGIGYIWNSNRNEKLAREIRDRSRYLEQLRAENLVFERLADGLRTPEAIEAGVRRWQLGLEMPLPQQILRISAVKPGAAATNLPVWRLAARPQ